MVIRVYWASVTSSRKIVSEQTRLRNILESNNIEAVWIDITTSSIVRNRMREECGNPKALAPQIFHENIYLGNVDDMNESIENEQLMEFFQIGSREQTHTGNATQTASPPSPVCNFSVENPTPENREPKPSNFTTKAEIIAPEKSVSSAVSDFERIRLSPKVSRKTITLQLSSDNGTNGDNKADGQKSKMDEERKRRILGLPVDGDDEKDATEIRYLQDKTNEGDVVGVKRYDASDSKIFEGVQSVPKEVNETTNEINHS